MALGWGFTLPADQVGTSRFTLKTNAPASGFYLHQTDPDSAVASLHDVYLSSTYTPDTTVVPEPASISLLALIGATVFGIRRLSRR